jgi:hypothetical protein
MFLLSLFQSAEFLAVLLLEKDTQTFISLWGLQCLQAFLDNKGKLHFTLYISLSLGKSQMTINGQEESFKKM